MVSLSNAALINIFHTGTIFGLVIEIAKSKNNEVFLHFLKAMTAFEVIL
jgi:hypothetical protein